MSVYKSMSRGKWSGKWGVSIRYPDGKRLRKIVGTKKQAEQLEKRLQAEIANGKWGLTPTEHRRFEDLVSEYLEYAEVSKATSTLKTDTSRIEKHLLPFFSGLPIQSITPQLVDRYKAKRVREGAAPKTVNNELLNLSHMMKMAIRWNYADRNVVTDVEKLKVPKNPPRFLSREEIECLIVAARNSHIYPLIVTALHTGMRKSELLNLQWSDIDFAMHSVTVQCKEDWHTKNYKARVIQMTPVLYRVLSEYATQSAEHHCEYVFTFKGEAIRQDVRRSFGRVVRSANLEGVTLHTLRHTFASQLVMAGVPLRDVQELMGHQSYNTTLRYAHLTPEHVGKQVMNLPFSGASPGVVQADVIYPLVAEREKRREGARRLTSG